MIRVHRGQSQGASVTPNAPTRSQHVRNIPTSARHILNVPTGGQNLLNDLLGVYMYIYIDIPGIYLCTFLCWYFVEALHFSRGFFLALLVAQHEGDQLFTLQHERGPRSGSVERTLGVQRSQRQSLEGRWGRIGVRYATSKSDGGGRRGEEEVTALSGIFNADDVCFVVCDHERVAEDDDSDRDRVSGVPPYDLGGQSRDHAPANEE